MPPCHQALAAVRRLGLVAVAALLAAILGITGVTPASAAGTASISGVVTNTRGDPLPNSSVRVFLPEDSDILKVIAQVYTDERGAFTFSGLGAGSYGVHAYGPNGTEYLGETWDNAASWREPTVITLVEGEARTDVNLQLAVAGIVRGIVTDTTGAPLPQIVVHLRRQLTSGGTEVDITTSTDESGRYEIRKLDPGTYRATFSDPAYVRLLSDPILVRGDEVVDFDASLTRGSVISGTAFDPKGEPAPSLNVTLYALRDGTWSHVDDAITGSTDGHRGRYEFRGLPAGTYTLEFWSSNGEENYPQEWWRDKPNQASSDLIELGTGASVTADVQLDAGALIQGTLTDEAGVVIGSHWARLFLDWEGNAIYVAQRWVRADGTFEFDRLRSGSYTIEFGGSEYLGEWWDDAPDQHSAQRIEVIDGETVSGVDAKLAQRMVLLSTPTLSGSPTVGSTLIVAAESPTPGAIFGYEWFADASSLSDASGPTLELGPAHVGTVITVRVTASAPGYAPVSKGSAPTDAVTARALTTSTPQIRGFPMMGSTLFANRGAWTSGTSFAYQWRADGVALDGATGSSLKLTSVHVGKVISVVVTGTKPGYTTVASVSSPTPKVAFSSRTMVFPHPTIAAPSTPSMHAELGDGAVVFAETGPEAAGGVTSDLSTMPSVPRVGRLGPPLLDWPNGSLSLIMTRVSRAR